MLSDSRTNAGVDHISTFRKMTVFEKKGDRVITLQDPSTTQHAPVGCGQGLEVHVPPVVQTAVQLACVTNVHEPSEKQHVPLGCGQGFGVQGVLLPRYEPAHPALVVCEHVPAGTQHAPSGCGHGFGVHETPLP